MIYILNTNLPNKKNIFTGLQYIFGIGENKSLKICKYVGISKNTPIKMLTLPIKTQIVFYIEKYIKVNENLKQFLSKIKEQQRRLKSYKGLRLDFKLPRRGQRTRTNAKTAKKSYT
jgi:small subunit ribosomal protein S13